MKRITYLLLSIMLMLSSCINNSKKEIRILEKDNLIAWCIVPFDANDRSPAERAAMLKELGITKLAYDYRDRHIPQFKEEISTLKAAGIELSAVWLWIQSIDANTLDPASESIVTIVEETGAKTEFWLSFPNEFYEGLSDEEKLTKAVETISMLNERLEKASCSIALYNHGDWFGNPENQIRIIEEIGSDNIGMVYNFHHAHHEIDKFKVLFPKMLPYLSAVNINGMTKEGPKIITIGEGQEEEEMIRFMIQQGYNGPVGILGHTEGEDIRLVLERNLAGLEKLKEELQ